MNAKEFADSVGATVVFPTEPNRPWVHSSQTDIRKTIERFMPAVDFMTGKVTQQVWDAAPQSWRMT